MFSQTLELREIEWLNKYLPFMKKLKTLREQKGLSIKEVSDKVNLCEILYTNLENGQMNPLNLKSDVERLAYILN